MGGENPYFGYIHFLIEYFGRIGGWKKKNQSDLGQLESKGKVHLSMPLNRNFGRRQVVGFVRVFFSHFKKKIK